MTSYNVKNVRPERVKKTKEEKRDKGFDVLGVSQKKNGRLKKEFLLKR